MPTTLSFWHVCAVTPLFYLLVLAGAHVLLFHASVCVFPAFLHVIPLRADQVLTCAGSIWADSGEQLVIEYHFQE